LKDVKTQTSTNIKNGSATGIRWLSHKYYLLLAEKKAKPDDVYAMIKYYHSWDKHGENYANDIFKMYHDSNNIPYRE
jgi:hypothetical protein